MPVSDVWGIGKASAAKLERLGLESVADLKDMDLRLARQLLTVTGERIVHELRGVSCMPLELVPPQQKGCAVTRMFNGRITELPMMLEAVSTHASRWARSCASWVSAPSTSRFSTTRQRMTPTDHSGASRRPCS